MKIMKFFTLSAAIILGKIGLTQAKDTCKPAPQITPTLVFDFNIHLVLGPGIDVGTDIFNAQQTYLSITGGTFCAKWNNGTGGTIIPGGTALYYQTANGTGPYRLEFEYLLRTVDEPPAYILVKQKGWEVSFVGRTQYALETGDARYAGLNTGVWTGVEKGYTVNDTGTYSYVDAYLVV